MRGLVRRPDDRRASPNSLSGKSLERLMQPLSACLGTFRIGCKSALPPRRAPLHPVDWVTQQAGVEDLPGAKLIAVSLLDPNPYQPRTTFDQDALDELAASIREHGILQPLTVRQAGDRYQIGVGERRKRAAERADLADVPCVVCTLS